VATGYIPSVGAAFVFSGPGFNTVTELTPSTIVSGANFGLYVALNYDGSVALVGGHYSSGPSEADAFSGPGYSTVTTFAGGACVALNGDGTVALIGSGGAVDVYSGSGFSTKMTLTGSGAVPGDDFGVSCALNSDGSVALAGADSENDSNSGAAYVFSGSNYSTQTKLTPDDGPQQEYFGYSVALDGAGDIAIVGAHLDNTTGSATIFSGTGYATRQKLTDSSGVSYEDFGTAVGLSSDGNIAMVSAPGAGTAGTVYRLSGPGYGTVQAFQASDGVHGDGNGYSASMSGDGSILLSGAPARNTNTGAAYIFNAPSASTAARIGRAWVVRRAGHVTVRWQAGVQSGIVGFDVYAGRVRLNARTIAPHRGHLYVFRTWRHVTGSVTLHTLLFGGRVDVTRVR
jgi:hypothetical protein